MATKKLIEVALPLEKINAESAREKSIRHGHPSTLHLWWARRPLAAARAVIWASLVDDPSSHPEQFPTEEDQNTERQRLFKILEDLVVWENSNNEKVLDAAKAEIMKSTNGNPPALLDPFAGGGAIPLEAQRLGLEAHAHDLNPVAVMINKAMIEIPPKFSGMAPVNSDAQVNSMHDAWARAEGLAEDVRYYGEWMKQEAYKRIGHLYPKVKVPEEQGGGEATVIAWIWARTVKCPNPACGCEIPLVRSFTLSKKKGHEAYVEPQFFDSKCSYTVKLGEHKEKGTVNRTAASCVACGTSVPLDYVRSEGSNHRMGRHLIAVVAEGKNGRAYYSPDDIQLCASQVGEPENVPCEDLPEKALGFRIQAYGITKWKDLYTNRQLTALTTFSDLVVETQKKVEADAIAVGMSDDHVPLCKGGDGARAYGEAVGVYLAFAVDRQADIGSTIASWINTIGAIRNTFGRQAIPMTWDFAEANPFSSSTGCFSNMVDWIVKCIDNFPIAQFEAEVSQRDAQSDCGLRNIMISTDPPYYDNIDYADLSDYFYIWMRRSLKDSYPGLFSTVLVPKTEELIATPFRHGGSMEKAKSFFESGMLSASKQMYLYAREDVPVTIYYAYKQSDSDADGTASSGWETMLNSIVKAGFAITGTWPMRTERGNRMRGNGSNALASSIVLVCRKRPEDAPQTTRRNLIATLRHELRPALKKLQASNIAPVDLAQSAIGPGMGVFSRYRRVLEADGTPMSVRSALQIINEELDLYFNEQVGDLDTASRFCVDLYTQYAYNVVKYGEAEVLANAKSTSIPMLAANGVVYAKAGDVHLVERADLPEKVDVDEKNIWLLTQQLTQAMAKGGVEACAQIVASMFGSNAERAKDLAYRLYTIAEQKKWSNEAYAYNALVVAWPDIQSRAAALKLEVPEQLDLFSTGLLDN
ncbi:DUF1156 domain-containing protein [Mediterraneibacter glycyrrhizinilyticus]|nr:DUF1156 domain-containing protein [Mediterraneibacter glycyrrhizinilyticus]MBM6852778.1 DUF1156 domain-containing protein [Mediterraneibacter glycyrrhizinilyticus]